MKKKTIGILLIFLVMIIGVGAISAADTNDTMLEEVSDTNVALTEDVGDANTAPHSSDLEQKVNGTSPASKSVSDIEEVSVDDSRNENHKVGVASSASNDVLSASNDDLLKSNGNNFKYNDNWYEDLDDAFSAAESNGGGIIYVWGGTYKYTSDSDDFGITFDTATSITLQPFAGHTVVFDAEDKGWMFRATGQNVHLTINAISFTRGNAHDGGAIEVENGAQLTLNSCIFLSNTARTNPAETGYGLGGAIVVDEGSLEANNCRFVNNKAGRYGGAICAEDSASITLNNCYFEGNTKQQEGEWVANDFDNYDDDSVTAISWSYEDCQFKAGGSIHLDVDYLTKSAHITPDVEYDINYAVLYKDGEEYERTSCSDGDTATFLNLETGTYTVYLIKGTTLTTEKRYEFSENNTFTIIEPNFVLDDSRPFETLQEAVNAIPNGGSGEITVEDATYTESDNFNVEIVNKIVTIRPKDISEDAEPVVFSADSQNYLFSVGSNAQLIMEDITIIGKFKDAALKFNTDLECSITDCTFNNTENLENQPGTPINAKNSNLVLSGCTFESSGQTLFKNTIANIDECTFDSNYGIQGGAINADSSSKLNITSSEFTTNVASQGGAIYASNLEVHDTTFIGNTAEIGAAVYITNHTDSLINITACVFDSNIATNYRNIYSESLTRKINLEYNEYDLNLTIIPKDGSYTLEYVLEGIFDWGSNLNNNDTILSGTIDDENIFGDSVTIEDNKFNMTIGIMTGGTHEFYMSGVDTQADSNDHFYGHNYYVDLSGNHFYLNDDAYAKIVIHKAIIILNLEVNDVLIPEIPVLNVYANYDHNYTIFIGTKYYQVEVVNGKGSLQLTDLDLGNYTVLAMRDSDENFDLAMNFTTFSISKTYSNFIVLSTNVEYDTLAEAVANSNIDDSILVKKGIYKETGIVISNKTLDIIASEGAVFDAQGRDANFIIVNEIAEVNIYGITFRGLQNRNTNYGAIVNYGDLTLDSCNFIDNKITKTSFAENGGAAIFNDGGSLEIENCTFINNVAPLKVSTAAVTSVSYEDISITSSKFINNSAREGGALHFKNISQFEAAVTSCDFEHNTAVKGSAIYLGNNSRYLSVTLSGFKKNNIINNLGENAQLEGGVIYANANTTEFVLDIDLSNFEENSNSQVDGGVIFLDGISKAYIGSSIFNNNSGKLGSVILVKNTYDKKISLLIDSSYFINNNAATGAIATSPKVTTFLDECIFANNTGEYRHVYSNGFTVAHDSIFEVKDAKLNALSVKYGEKSIISGTLDIGTNLYAVANLTVSDENVIAEIKNDAFTYETGILSPGKYHAVLNSISDYNNNTYLMDSINEIFRVSSIEFDLDVSVDNITYGETIKVVENLPSNAVGTIGYELNGNSYTKEELEALKLDAGNYTLVAYYNDEYFLPAYSLVNFEVYKANPTISVEDVEVGYNDTIIVNIKTNVPSIYTIEIGDYKTDKYINGSRSVEIEKAFEPDTYTIKVTSQERVNYKSNSTEVILKVNKNLATFALSVSNSVANPDDSIIEVSAPENAVGNIKYTVTDSNKNVVYSITQSCRDDLVISDLDDGTYEINAVFEGDDRYYSTGNIQKTSLSIKKSSINEDILTSTDTNKVGDKNDGGNFIYQADEESDCKYYETLEEAVDEALLWGSGIITVRGGTYTVSGIDIEGEVELTIKAYQGEEVIFNCGGANYFLLLTYDSEFNWTEDSPVPTEEQTEGPTITLENITVTGGNCTYGGAIDLEAGVLNLTNCNFINNHAKYGGAIYIGSSSADYDATVIATNTTFKNNYASEEGGAIYMASDSSQDTYAFFYFCTFLDNYQGEDDEKKMNYFGGDDVGSITRQYCVFNATGEIYNFTMDKINQTVYVKGTSNDTFNSVVLLYFDQAPLYTINNHGARDFNVNFENVMGGNYTIGVMNNHDFNTYIFDVTFEMKVPNFIISEDEVYENLTDAIDAVGENGIIYANVNYYDEENMEIDIRKSFTLKNFRDRTVVFDGSSQLWFFTVAEGCNVVFEGINFADGGMKTYATIENYGNLTFKNCTFNHFETGAIIYNSGFLNMSNCEFSDNYINNSVVLNDARLFIDDVSFSSNVINISSVVYNNGIADIINSNFTENINLGNGGAIYNTNTLNVENTVFNENEGANGGAIYSTGKLQVLNSTFENNNANGYGGAIYNGNELNIFNSTFNGGFAGIDGGAIYNNNIMTVNNSTFVANSATGKGGAIYNNKSLELTESVFGINHAEEFANIYNAGDIQFIGNTFDFYDVVLVIPDGQYGLNSTIVGTLDPQFNMDIQVVLPGFVNNEDATVTISDGVFEHVTDILPKGVYDVKLNEIIYDVYGNIYYGEAVTDRLIIHKANVYINLTVDDVILPGAPVLKISASKDGLIRILFNNKISTVDIIDGHATLTLDAVEEGNYSVLVAREGDENYNDVVNTTTFSVSEYEGNFVVNSTGNKFETLREAIADSSDDDIIYVREGNYTGADNLDLTISGKKLSIIPLGDVVFDANSTDLNFLTVDRTSDVTLCDVVITGFNKINKDAVIVNRGNLTVDGVTVFNNTLVGSGDRSVIYNGGNLTIVGSEFYDNKLYSARFIYSLSSFNIIVNESTFENNTVNRANLISIIFANSVKIISNVFSENNMTSEVSNIIFVSDSKDILISSEFYNNTLDVEMIYADWNNNLLVNNSIFTGNKASQIISTKRNNQITVSESLFTDNIAKNIVLSSDNISVLESTFSGNTLSGNGALSIIKSGVNASVDGCVFSHNNADNYRNIYSDSPVNISNTAFDAINVDFSVHDIDYGQKETIEGTIDIGTNLNFIVNLDINGNTYSVNVTDNKFTYDSGILNGGDYNVVLNANDNNLNHFVFDKITKMFTVNRVSPELSVSIDDITQGEKLNVTVKINRKAAHIVYELNGTYYNKDQLENLTLKHGNYLVTAIYRGDKNYLPATDFVYVVVNKITPNITVSDVVVDYGDEIKINVNVDAADYYTLFIDNGYDESISLYVDGSGTFTIPSENLKPGNYSITVYKIETDDYNEAYGYANLTVNKAKGFFRLSNEMVYYGENATVVVKAPVNAYGNITYTVYDEDANIVYSIKQSCVEELVVPKLPVGTYMVTGTYEGDIYYTNDSIINSSIILVNPKNVELNITVSNITYGENASVKVESNFDGAYLVYVDDTNYTVNVKDGVGYLTVEGLAVGSHVANVTYSDDMHSATNSTTFEVSKIKTTADIEFGNGTTGVPPLIVNLPPDAGGNVSVYVNGILSQIVNLTNGSAIITVSNLVVGENNVTVVYSGDDNYDPFNKTLTINRNATIISSDMTRGYNSGLDYTAKLLDENGSPLANADVTIKVGTITYTVKTDSNGVLNFNNKVAVGNYGVAIVNPVTGEYKLTNLKIVKRITGNKDVKIFFADGSNYKVRIVGDNGNYVGAGEVVKINVAGKTYSVKTDKNGYANLKLKLKVKKHTITVTYKGFTTKNKVTVKSIVKPVKKTVKVKKRAKKLKIKVKLKGKKVLKKKRVYMKFKGKTYKAKTNKKGIATFKVPKKVIKKLKKGKKYKAKFTYKVKANGKTLKNTAKCYVKVR